MKGKRIKSEAIRRALEKREKMAEAEVHTCCICGEVFTGHGHNAAPVEEGLCCDECNYDVVIRERLRRSRRNIQF